MQYKEWSFEHCFESKSAYGGLLDTDPQYNVCGYTSLRKTDTFRY